VLLDLVLKSSPNVGQLILEVATLLKSRNSALLESFLLEIRQNMDGSIHWSPLQVATLNDILSFVA